MGGHALYTFLAPVYPLGFTYPPLAAVLLWPLGLLPLVTAERVWLVATIAATAAFLALAVRLLPMATAAVADAVGHHDRRLDGAVVPDQPARPGERLPGPGRPGRRGLGPPGAGAGVATGLAAAVKITPLAGAAYFAASGRWRTCIVAVTTFVVATLASALVAPTR